VRGLAQVRLRELPLFAGLIGFGAAVPLLTRLPLPRMAATVTRPPRPARPPRGPRPSQAEVDRLAELVALAPRVAHPLVRTGCLTRGLTLFWFLRRAGLDVELRFGLDPAALEPVVSGADGHCWLTLDGEPYLEDRDPGRFRETYRLPLR
jgi:hypothetical protein